MTQKNQAIPVRRPGFDWELCCFPPYDLEQALWLLWASAGSHGKRVSTPHSQGAGWCQRM